MTSVEPGRINSAPIEQGGHATIPVGVDPLVRDPIIDQKLGWVGKVFGYGDEKKGNIAALACVFGASILTICLIAMLAVHDTDTRSFLSSLITPVFGLMTGAIGYITGKKDVE